VQAVTQVNAQVAPKVSWPRRLNLQPEGESSMCDRNLTDAIKHFGGVVAMACIQGYAKQLEKPVLPWGERPGER